MIVKLLAEQQVESLSLKGGCTSWSESTLVKMPHCWKFHVVAHISMVNVIKFQTLFSFYSQEKCWFLGLELTKWSSE